MFLPRLFWPGRLGLALPGGGWWAGGLGFGVWGIERFAGFWVWGGTDTHECALVETGSFVRYGFKYCLQNACMQRTFTPPFALESPMENTLSRNKFEGPLSQPTAFELGQERPQVRGNRCI
jgi:hypothetical protein